MGYRTLRIALLLAVCWGTPVASAQEPVRVLAYPVEPYIYTIDGKPAGLEYEILEYLAKASGRTLEIQWVERFADLLPRLGKGEGDVAAATITITPARRLQFEFSVSLHARAGAPG
ncbi:hypothetical protein BH23ACI1_BH23ACI1_13480 [soil metagenome]